MKTPKIKGLTRKQAEKLKKAIEVLYPEEPKKAAKVNKKELREMKIRADAYAEGSRRQQEYDSAEIKKLKASLESRAHKIEALRAVTSFLSAAGQTVGEFARAMASEGGQL